MKKIVVLIVVMVLACSASYAQDSDLPHITVFGTATTKVTPDRMIWSLTVKNTEENVQYVAEQHTAIVEKVLQFLKEHTLPDKEIQTARMEFGENWEYQDQSRIQHGYFASTHISFMLEDFQKYTLVWLGLSKMAHISIEGVYYDHSQRIEYQNRIRQQAVLAAKEKAIALARTLGADIGEPLSVEEDTSLDEYFSRSQYSNKVAMTEDEVNNGESLAPGTIPIRMRVKITFRLITPE